MKIRKEKLSRRNFLLTVGAGSAAGAAAIIGAKPSSDPALAGPGKDAKGYQVTEHVQNYYRTARI